MTNYDDMKCAVEALSGGKNTVILDDIGMPSIMVPVPKMKYSDLITGGTQDTLPAFIVGGGEIPVVYASKYQNIVVNDRAYSLAYKDPRANITFDAALAACRKKGAGWHLQTNALWGALVNWCYKNGTPPHGNSNYGAAYGYAHEKAVPSMALDGSGRVQRTATGSGPVTWYHDHTGSGIADLCGNVWEWVAGLRTVYGEIQIIPYANAMMADCDMSETSTEWKAIKPDGSLVDPGTSGTLKFDYISNKITISTSVTTSSGSVNTALKDIAAASGVTIPQLLVALGLAPDSAFTYGGDMVYVNPAEAERFPDRGAGWYHTSNAGVGALYLNNPRGVSGANLGFRAAYYETL